MRFLLRAEWSVEAGNTAISEGRASETIHAILDESKPEAACFLVSNGKRTTLLVVDVDDASQIPALAEPWFHAFQANIEIDPVMVLDDLDKANPAMQEAMKKYG